MADLEVIFMECDCYVWPLALGEKVGKCGYCGVQPYKYCEEPDDGKAHPIE